MGKEGEPQPPQYLTMEEVVRTARMETLRKGGHAPTIIVEGSRHELLKGEISDLPESHEDKLDRMYTAGFLMAHSGDIGDPQQVFFICEGWMSMAKGENRPPERPKDDPNRKEVLFVMHVSLVEQRSKAVGLEMIRSDGGQLVALRTIAPPPGAEVTEDEGDFRSPLLGAFMEGFLMGRRTGLS